MAISFSRPDPSSPAAVGSAAFPTNRRGFDQGEVRDFLRMVAAELARLQERERFLESEMKVMQTRGMSAPGRLDEETVTTLLGEEAARVLSTARDAGIQIRDRAEESATRLVKDAAEDAARIRESAMLEAQRIREDAARDAEAEIEMAKQQGRDMVNEAREYREKVLSELSRRRDAARAQIEQLLHGRDRLMNAFERARIATEDVIGSLTDAHDEPEFIVDLSPTTGPVPVVNPDHPSVRAFDHENESEVAAPTSSDHAPSAAVYDHESEAVGHEVVVEMSADEDVIVEVVEQIEAAVEELESMVENQTTIEEVDHPVHAPVVVIDAHPSTGDSPVEDAGGATEGAPTNVVSLFGRQRRTEVPEVPDTPEVVEVVEAPAPVVVSAPVESATSVEQPVERPQVAAKEAVTKGVKAKGTSVDDIFSRLREGSTADVAAKASTVARDGENKEVAPKQEPSSKKKSVKRPMPVHADPAKFAERDEVLSPLVGAISKKLKRALADEQNSVLEHLRAKRSSLEIDAVMGTVADHAHRYAESIVDDAMVAASAGAKSVKTAGGSSRRVTQSAITGFVSEIIESGLVAAFREDVRIAIGESEGDRDILASLLRDVYRQWKIEMMDTHVDHVVVAAFNRGSFLALEPGAHIGWMVDPSAKCCSECDDNTLAGAITRGDDFPTGHHHPPAHPGCRCLIGPVQD